MEITQELTALGLDEKGNIMINGSPESNPQPTEPLSTNEAGDVLESQPQVTEQLADFLQDPQRVSAYMKEEALKLVAEQNKEARMIEATKLILSTEAMYALKAIFNLDSAPTLEEAKQHPVYQDIVLYFKFAIQDVAHSFPPFPTDIAEQTAWFDALKLAQKKTTATGSVRFKEVIEMLMMQDEVTSDWYSPARRDHVERALEVYFTRSKDKEAFLITMMELVFLAQSSLVDSELVKEHFPDLEPAEIVFIEQILKTLVYGPHMVWEMAQIELRHAATYGKYPEDKKKDLDSDSARIEGKRDFAVIPALVKEYLAAESEEKKALGGEVRKKIMDTLLYDFNLALEAILGTERWQRVKWVEARQKALEALVQAPSSEELKHDFATFLDQYVDLDYYARRDLHYQELVDKLAEIVRAAEAAGQVPEVSGLAGEFADIFVVTAAVSAYFKRPIICVHNLDKIQVDAATKVVSLIDVDPGEPHHGYTAIDLYRMPAQNLGYTYDTSHNKYPDPKSDQS